RVGRDSVFLGHSLENQAGSAVGRDVVIGGYQALLGGSVERNVQGGMEGLELRGSVGGNVDISVGNGNGTAPIMTAPPPAVGIPGIRPGITVAETGRVGGRLTYTSTREFPIAERQVLGGVTWNARPVEPIPQS